MYKSVCQLVIDELKSVRSATSLFDGWIDRYKKIPFLGIRTAFVNKDWEMKVYTLSSSPLENNTAELMKTHIKEVVYDFFQRRVNQMTLHTVHDGATNTIRTSELPNIKDPQHCLAHALHLLLTENGMKKIPGVQN